MAESDNLLYMETIETVGGIKTLMETRETGRDWQRCMETGRLSETLRDWGDWWRP